MAVAVGVGGLVPVTVAGQSTLYAAKSTESVANSVGTITGSHQAVLSDSAALEGVTAPQSGAASRPVEPELTAQHGPEVDLSLIDEQLTVDPEPHDSAPVELVVPQPDVVPAEPPLAVESSDVPDLASSVELEDQRDRFSKVHVLEDGSEVVIASTTPIHFRDQAGQWAPIDLTISRGADGVIRGGGNEYVTSFLPFGDPEGGVRLDGHGRSVRFAPVGAQRSAPEVEPDGESVRYREVFPGVDIVYVLHGAGITEYIELTRPGTARRFDFEVFGASLETDAEGRVTEVGKTDDMALRVAHPISFLADGREVPVEAHEFSATPVTAAARSGSTTTEPDSVVRLGLSDKFVDGLDPTDFPVRIDPDFTWGSETQIRAYQYYHPSGGSTGVTYSDALRTGNPYVSSTSTARWRSVAYFDYSNHVTTEVNVEAAWLAFNVSCCTTPGAQPVDIFVANSWSPHTAHNPRDPNLDVQNPPDLYVPGPGWNPLETVTLPASGATNFQLLPTLAKAYDAYLSENSQGLAFLFSGNNAMGQYTLKKFNMQLMLRTNRRLTNINVGNASQSTQHAVGRTVSWTASGAGPVDPGAYPVGDDVRYNPLMQIKDPQDGAWKYYPSCLSHGSNPSNWPSSGSRSCQLPESILGQGISQFRYRAQANDLHDKGYADGTIDSHTVTSSWKYDTFDQSQPPAPAVHGSSPSGIYGVDLTPTVRVNSVVDPDGDRVKYNFVVCKVDDNGCIDGEERTSGWQTGTQYTIPPGFLEWGDTVAWSVFYGDAEQYLSVSPPDQSISGTVFYIGRTEGTNPELSGGFPPHAADVMGVDPSNGNWRYQTTDLSVPAIAMPLGVTRTYNSIDYTTDGPFGPGWSTNIGVRLQADGAGNLTVFWPDGRREFHGKNPDGSYGEAIGWANELVKNGANYELTEPSGTVYVFNSSLKLASMTSESGKSVTFTYPNSSTQVITDTESGRTMTLTYNGANRVTAAASAGATWKYYYRTDGRLEKACSPIDNTSSGECTTYTYGGSGRLRGVTLPEGNQTRWVTYSGGGGKVSSVQDGESNAWTFTYQSASTTQVVDSRPSGNSQSFTFDSDRRLVQTEDAASNTIVYAYDGNSYLESVTNEANQTEEFVNDDDGRVVLRIDRDQAHWRNVYDADGRLTHAYVPAASPDGNGEFPETTIGTTYIYDGDGNKITETNAEGEQQRWEYTDGTEPALGGGTVPAGLLKSYKDPKLHETSYEYDAAGDLRRQTEPSGLVTEFDHDAAGRTTMERTMVDGEWRTTTFTYDDLGRMTTQTDPTVVNPITGVSHALVTEWFYDGNGRVWKETRSDVFGNDPTRTVLYTYDDNDRVETTTDPDSGLVTTTYDEVGNIATVTDAEGRVTRTTYDHANRPTRVELVNFEDPTDPGNTTTIVLSETTYTPHGLAFEETDARQQTIRYGYNARGHLTSATWLNSTSVSGTGQDFVAESNIYDGRGRLITKIIDNGRRRFDYTHDDADRVVAETEDADVAGHITDDRVTSYDYDDNGNRTITRITQGQSPTATCVASTCEEIRNTFDEANLVLTTTIENGTTDIVTTLVRNEAGEVISTTDPEQAVTTMSYDPVGRLIETVAATVDVADNGTVTSDAPTATIGYDTFGNPTHERDADGNVTVSTYDVLDRLSTITHPSYDPPAGGPTIVATESFGYDAVGNLTSRTDRLGNTTDIDFDALNRQVRITQPAPVTGAPRPQFLTAYDDNDNITRTVDPAGAIIDYTYDVLNRRSTMTEHVTRNGVVEQYTTTWEYDGSGNIVSEQAPTGDTIARLWARTGELLVETDAASNTSEFSYDVGGRLLVATDPLGRTTRHTYDLAGRMLSTAEHDTSGSAVITETTGYDHVGRPISHTNGDGVTTSRSYDDLGRLVEVRQPQGSGQPDIVTTYGYDRRGNQTLTVDGNDEHWWITYNNWGLAEDRIEPATTAHPAAADRTFTTSYDAAGRPVVEAQPGGIAITRSYDDLGRLTNETSTSGGTKTFDHDPVGRVTSFSTPASTQTVEYNERGQIIASSGIMGGSVFDYDAKGRMVERTDAAGTTYYAWWPNDTLKNLTDPVTGDVRTYTWTTATELDTVDYGNGTTRDYDWDPIGRLDTDELIDGSTTIWSADYDYDPAGRVHAKTIAGSGIAGAGTNTYDYDDAGRLTEWTGPGSAGPTTYTWDNNGNRQTATGTTYAYDERNRLITETTTESTTSHHWTPRGALDETVETFPAPDPYLADTFTDPTLDPSNWSTTSADATVQTAGGRLEFALDSRKDAYGQVTALEPSPATVDQDITVDYQFGTNANNSQATLTLTVADSTSEKVWIEIDSTSATATAFERVSGVDTQLGTFAVDETTSQRSLRMRFVDGTLSVRTWDPNGVEPAVWDGEFTAADVDQPGDVVLRVDREKGSQTISVDNWLQDDPAGTPAPDIVDYDFDGLGRMIEADGVVYAYDALDRIGTRDGVQFKYSGTEVQPTFDGVTHVARTPGGQPAAAGDATVSVHLTLDRHRDLVASHDETGLVDSVSYDPFGVELARAGSSDLMIGFQGHYTDPSTGMVDMGERWYQASTATFVSRDTFHGNLETPVSLNRYTYANNDPMGFWDPDGRCAVRIAGYGCAGSRRFSQHSGTTSANRARAGFERAIATAPRRSRADTSRANFERAMATNPNPAGSRSASARYQFERATGQIPRRPEPRPVWKPSVPASDVPYGPAVPPDVQAHNIVITALAKEADVDFATMRASLNCVESDECVGQDLIDALATVEDTEYGQVIYQTIDVAHQQDFGKVDGNWSKDDIAAASDLATIQQLIENEGASAEVAAAHASLVSSVANRLGTTNNWEDLDRDLNFWDKHGGKIMIGIAVVGVIATGGAMMAPGAALLGASFGTLGVATTTATIGVNGINLINECVLNDYGDCESAFGSAAIDVTSFGLGMGAQRVIGTTARGFGYSDDAVRNAASTAPFAFSGYSLAVAFGTEVNE